MGQNYPLKFEGNKLSLSFSSFLLTFESSQPSQSLHRLSLSRSLIVSLSPISLALTLNLSRCRRCSHSRPFWLMLLCCRFRTLFSMLTLRQGIGSLLHSPFLFLIKIYEYFGMCRCIFR